MHVRVRLDGAKPLRWHAALLRRIGDSPGVATVSIDDAPGPGTWPHTADLLFRLEALVHRLPRLGTVPILGAELARWRQPGTRPDIVLDLCGDVPSGPGTWHLAYDGRSGADALLASLLAGAVPHLTLVENGVIRAAGRLGADRPGIVLACFEDALARTITLIAAALRDRIAGRGGVGASDAHRWSIGRP